MSATSASLVRGSVPLGERSSTIAVGPALKAVIVLIIVAACAAAMLLRQRGAGALDTLWAEDGTIFLQDALADPSPFTWFKGYAGYLHLAPRALASLAAMVSLDWAPFVLSGGSALVAALLGLLAYHAAAEHIPRRAERAGLVAALLGSSSAGLEVINVAANLHWYLPVAAAIVALWRPVRRFEIMAGGAVLFVATASDPFVVLVAPIAGWRFLRQRERSDVVWAAAIAAGFTLQAGVVLASSGSRPLDPFGTSPASHLAWYGFHVLETAAFGIVLRDALMNAIGVAGSAALALATLGLLLWPAMRAAIARPAVPAALVSLHLGFYFLPVVLAGTSAPRYAVTPIVLLYAVIAWGLASQNAAWVRGLRVFAAALLAILIVADFAPWNERAAGPRWSVEMSSARASCELGLRESAVIPIPPRSLPAGDPRALDGYWTVTIPCRLPTSNLEPR